MLKLFLFLLSILLFLLLLFTFYLLIELVNASLKAIPQFAHFVT